MSTLLLNEYLLSMCYIRNTVLNPANQGKQDVVLAPVWFTIMCHSLDFAKYHLATCEKKNQSLMSCTQVHWIKGLRT